jgi:HlyD family secretion protein
MADNAILAPFDALVLNIKAQPGDGVPREGELLTLGDPAQERVIFELMALDARQVAIAMPVRVSMIGPNPQPFTGQVVSIAPQALSPGQDSSRDQPTVQAVAQLDRPSGKLIPGSAVSVEVLLSQRQGVLAVPTTALQRDGQETYLWVVDGASKARRRAVQTGLSTLDAVEITQGLQVGDRVIATPPVDFPLSDGMAVSTPPAPSLPAP